MENNLYHYRASGLDNVYLNGGFSFTKTSDGEDVVVIEDVEGLHRAIRTFLIDLARPLTPREFRFLRKALDVSQRQFAVVVNVDEQTVSMWERGNSPIQGSADVLLRAWVREHDSGKPAVRELTERLNALDRQIYTLEKRFEFTRSGSIWIQQAAA